MTAFIPGDTRHRSSPIINPGWAPAQVEQGEEGGGGGSGRCSIHSGNPETLLHRRRLILGHTYDGINPPSQLSGRNHYEGSVIIIKIPAARLWQNIIPANVRRTFPCLWALLWTRIAYKGPRELNIRGSISAVVGWRQSISPSLSAVWPGAWRAKPPRSSARKRWLAHKTANVSSHSLLSEEGKKPD